MRRKFRSGTPAFPFLKKVTPIIIVAIQGRGFATYLRNAPRQHPHLLVKVARLGPIREFQWGWPDPAMDIQLL